MSNLLYVKYNRTRQKAFQTKVEILQEANKKIVLKSAIRDEAKEHINNMLKVKKNYSDYYNNIKLVNSYAMNDGVAFDFIKGSSITANILSEAVNASEVIEVLNNYFNLITDINDEYRTEFCITEDFKKIFPSYEGLTGYKGTAYKVTNLDPIFDNFIKDGNTITAIDYEWFIPVIIPIEFIKYRIYRHFYYNNQELCGTEFDCRSFIAASGVQEAYIDVFDDMEYDFQQYVHGVNFSAMYTKNYEKKIITDIKKYIDDKEEEIELSNNHIRNIEAQIIDYQNQNDAAQQQLEIMQNQLNKYHKALHNPLYGLYCLLKKLLPGRIKRGLKRCKARISAILHGDKTYKQRNQTYDSWIRKIEKDRNNELTSISISYKPLISVLVPVYNVRARLLKECIESVISQTYDNWELCLVDDCSTLKETIDVLKKYENNSKIKIEYRSENGHISRTTNQALNMAEGEYIALLDCDDVLTRNALLEVVLAINNHPDADFLYSDEDKIDEDSKVLFDPYFKPDWSPDTLMTCMYTCHLGVYKTNIIRSVGGFRVGYEGSQDYDLVLRLMEIVDFKSIIHIPHILYHWRTRKESTASSIQAKDYIFESTKKAKYDALERRGLKGELDFIQDGYQYRVRYIPSGKSKVSIIIPSKDNPDIINRCISSIRNLTDYKNYEIIVVDNGSNPENKRIYSRLCIAYNCQYIYSQMEFNFSKMCNLGAENSKGEYLLFLNDDVEVIDASWLDRMLGQAEVSYTGAVGAKLYYPNSTLIQHAGVINIPAGPSHALCRYDDKNSYYIGINRYDNNFLAVTAACLMVKKEKFHEVGGFDEELRVAYNDVDFCFKLNEAGYYNVVRNDVILYHYESLSRGNDSLDDAKMKRLIGERNKLYERHKQYSLGEFMDPYYNHNLVQTDVNYGLNIMDVNKDSLAEYIELDLSKYKMCEEMVCVIDTNVMSSDHIYIKGYAYISNSIKSNKEIVKIVIIKDDRVIALKTNKEHRPDLAANKKTSGRAMSGFNILTKFENYDPSGSDIAIIIGNNIKYL